MRANAKSRKVAYPFDDPFTGCPTLAYDNRTSARNEYSQAIDRMVGISDQNRATASANVLRLSEGTGVSQRCDASIIVVQDLAKNLLGVLSQERRGDGIHSRRHLHADRRFDVLDRACRRVGGSGQTIGVTSPRRLGSR